VDGLTKVGYLFFFFFPSWVMDEKADYRSAGEGSIGSRLCIWPDEGGGIPFFLFLCEYPGLRWLMKNGY